MAEEKTSTLFVEGCPTNNQAFVRKIEDPEFSFSGINALSGVGDYLLANEQVAFAITASSRQDTYFHYPGILVDAAAVTDCQQSGGDSFDELALMIARLNLVDPDASVIRAFHGESFQVINDGSDGQAAHLRVIGYDDHYWLLEYELISRYYRSRHTRSDSFPQYKPLSEPMQLQVVVDYILPPDSPNLEIRYQLQNLSNKSNHRLTQIALTASGAGPKLTSFARWDLDLQSIAGLQLQTRMPWMSSPVEQGSFAFAMQSPDLFTTTHFSGIDALFDLSQVSRVLKPAGEDGDRMQKVMYVSPVAGDEADAVSQLLNDNPAQVNTRSLQLQLNSVDPQGLPVGKVHFQLQAFNLRSYETFFSFYSDSQGVLERQVHLPGIEPYQSYRLIASAAGRADQVITIGAQEIQSGQWILQLQFGSAARLSYQVMDQNQQLMPFKLTLIDRFGRQQDHYLTSGNGELPVAPGNYSLIASRGFEYRYHRQSIEILPGDNQISLTLQQMMDTSGFMSYDAHVHSSPSPDSTVSLEDRIATVAAHGLEVVVSTDHEAITDLAPTIEQMQMQQYVASVPGQEVTATRPEHTIAFPLPAQEGQNARGNPVRWYQKDLQGIWDAEKERGAEIRTLAHPKGSNNILTLIEWNRMTGKPDKELVDFIGLQGRPWSWDFEAIELINGNYRVFYNPSDPQSTGLLDDWISFLNFGHRITATGASDTHGLAGVGMPRNFFATDLQSTEDFQWGDLTASIKAGKVVASTGAFVEVFASNQQSQQVSLGETLSLQGNQLQLQIKVQALPQVAMSDLLVLANCQQLAKIPLQNPLDNAIKLDTQLTIALDDFSQLNDKDLNLVLVATGANQYLPGLINYDGSMGSRKIARAVTNPIYIDRDRNEIYDPPGGMECNYDAS